jgi:hypothetical protein
LRIKEKFKIIREIENGKKKTGMCQEFGPINSMIQMIWENRTRIISAVEQNKPRIKQLQMPK